MSRKQRLDTIKKKIDLRDSRKRGGGKILGRGGVSVDAPPFRPGFMKYFTPVPDRPDITTRPPYYYNYKTGEVLPADEYEKEEAEYYRNLPAEFQPQPGDIQLVALVPVVDDRPESEWDD